MKKKTRGRPPTVHGAYHPCRQLGRVSDEDWQRLKDAAERAGKPFSEWATRILLAAAKRD